MVNNSSMLVNTKEPLAHSHWPLCQSNSVHCNHRKQCKQSCYCVFLLREPFHKDIDAFQLDDSKISMRVGLQGFCSEIERLGIPCSSCHANTYFGNLYPLGMSLLSVSSPTGSPTDESQKRKKKGLKRKIDI